MAQGEGGQLVFQHVFTAENPGHIGETYKFSGKLGEGTYGQVKQATHKETGASRAIKSIDISNIKDKNRFEQEVGIQQRLHHPNIVRLYEVFKDAKNVYLVMELCTGGELFDRIVEQAEQSDCDMAFGERQSATYMLQILGAMHYLHTNHFVHRDIKPENFLMQDESKTAEIKVIDFGLAKYNPSGSAMKTKAGTPYYVAPQVLQGNYTHKCDVWSCGVIAYVLLCGYPPFYGDKDSDILRRVRAGKFEFPSPDWDNTSDDAKDFISKMLTFDEAKRAAAEDMLNHPWLSNAQSSPSGGKMHLNFVDKLRKFQSQKKLKKVALTLIAEQLEDKELQGLRETFKGLDVNQDGSLTLQEIRQGLEKHKIQIPGDIEAIMAALDTDGSGSIDYTEFIAASLSHKQYMKKAVLWAAFRRFDRDGNGYISAKELAAMIHEEGDDLRVSKELIKEVDQNGDGEVSFEEFQKMMGGSD